MRSNWDPNCIEASGSTYIKLTYLINGVKQTH